MNKIVLSSNNINYQLDDKIIYEFKNELINKLNLKILKNTELEINVENDSETKLDLQIEIEDDVSLKLVEIKKGSKTKILSKYDLGFNSKLSITKINDIEAINERNIVNLNGVGAKVELVLKTVSNNTEKYDVIVNHNNYKTESDITSNGVNLNGKLYFNINTHILKNMKKCIANQNNRIINLTDNECAIRPNLLIDEEDVIANHSALIGSFKDEEIFYMQRLGINKDEAVKLLMEGFIKNKISSKLADIYKKYWR